ncbi:MAG: class I SAM-dependent methyltransferase [Candidatus Thermoplasmatota archaeon]|jgi:SAM-dependent methyltransferase|nr:class I SAM-dependent methyltransferase [Candidatus Thermoplasmatota archaeon]MCL5681375.1 class I SAM-dependent methyltransferase [Candidatus Thermoplasmatota archaeon]
MTEVKKDRILGLEYDDEGFRMSTPIEIAYYKSKKLATKSIADLGCGIGIQSIYFSEYFDTVKSVERDPSRLKMARKNANALGKRNIEFVEGDVLDKEIVREVGNPDIISSDPSRIKRGNYWTFDDLSPNPLEIMRKYKAKKYSFDLPVHFRKEIIPKDWEIEYVSVNGEPKRIIAYVGEGMNGESRAVSLPSESVVKRNEAILRDYERTEVPMSIIYQVDQVLSIADLVPEYLDDQRELTVLLMDRKRTFMTSDKIVSNDFIINGYEIIDEVPKIEDLNGSLKKHNCGKIFLRFEIPSDQYYILKSKIEEGLNGNESLYVFLLNNKYYIGRSFSRSQP